MKNLRSPIASAELLRCFENAISLTAASDASSREASAREALERMKAFGVIGDWASDDEERLFVPDLYLHGLGMIRAGW